MSGTSLLPLKYFKFVPGNASKGQLGINRDTSDHTHEKRKLDRVYEQVRLRLLFTALTNLDLQAFLSISFQTQTQNCSDVSALADSMGCFYTDARNDADRYDRVES